MTEEVISENEVSSDVVIEDEPQLYAGKFKSVDELEKAYKEGFGVHLKNKELESKIQEFTTVPDDYTIPENISLRNAKLSELKELAKTSGMTQDQFNNAAKKVNDDIQKNLSQYQEAMEKVGDDKINVVKGYLDKKLSAFDDDIKGNILTKVISNNDVMEKIMSDREKDLNSNVPGINQTADQKVMRENDMKREKYEAGLKTMLDPRDKAAKAKFINICRDIGHARQDAQK
jgi:hypothetical protein